MNNRYFCGKGGARILKQIHPEAAGPGRFRVDCGEEQMAYRAIII
jgi:hypothetical protein